MLAGILFFLSFFSSVSQAAVWNDAVEFYEEYGTGKICFHDGAFYYGSKGSKGDTSGIRYCVVGQKFVLRTESGKSYSVMIALQDSQIKGSCKRISYKTVDGFRYSLYRVKYQNLYRRFQLKYPDTDLSEVMYNHNVTLQIDFCLTLSIQGTQQGILKEQADGGAVLQGKIYKSYQSISQAAGWSAQTMSALKGYFDISMSIYQPSSYKIRFYKSLKQASGTMKTLTMYYGQKRKLTACSFQMKVQVTFIDHVKGLEKDRVYNRKFQGWSLTSKGNVVYKNRQAVKNLSKIQGDRIDLYARWKNVSVILPGPEIYGLECETSGKKFIGWSTKKYGLLPSGTRLKDVPGVIKAGTEVSITQDKTYYAVWSKIEKKVVFRTPDDAKTSDAIFYYNSKRLTVLRKQAAGCFAGTFDFLNHFAGAKTVRKIFSTG